MPLQVPADRDPDAGIALSPSGPFRAVKELGLVLLCVIWALLGTFGHDPWKIEDATAFGIAYEMLQRGDALVPHLAGEALVGRPPLVYAAAAAAAAGFSPALSLPDAARLAAAIALLLTLAILAATARELHGNEYRWLPVLLFIGSVGLWDRAHQVSPELGLLVGVTSALYGFALGLRRPIAGGAMLGVGAAIAFLSRGFLGPIWLAVTAVTLPVAFAHWRTRRYAAVTAVAVLVGVLTGGSWAWLLHARAPEYLDAWWSSQSLGDYFFPLSASGSGDPMYFVKNLPWFAWPALPLVLWTFWTRGRGFNGGLATPGVQLPATIALVIVVSVALMAEPRAIVMMPMLVPLSLLGALEIDTLKRGFSGALDWFGILTFGLLSALVWWLWFDAYANGMSASVARLFRDTESGFRPTLDWIAIGLSAALSVLWLLLVRPARQSNRRTVLNWAAGMTLLWALFTTIWLPYLDSRRSYRTVAESLSAALPRDGCVASRNLGEAQRALFHYFGDVKTVREERVRDHRCATLLVQYGRHDQDARVPDGWEPIWEGRRRGDDTERYVLYRRKSL